MSRGHGNLRGRVTAQDPRDAELESGVHEITQPRLGMGIPQAPGDLGSGPLDDGVAGGREPPRDRPAVYAIASRQLVQAQMVDELMPK